MKAELQELIRDARKELRKASGLPLTPEEHFEDSRKAALEDMQIFMLRNLGVNLSMLLAGRAEWTDKGPAVILNTGVHVFHLRKKEGNGSCFLFIVGGDGEREIARLEASDPIFSSRVLVAIDDAVSLIDDAVSFKGKGTVSRLAARLAMPAVSVAGFELLPRRYRQSGAA
jgi:hypothetical protein